MQRVACHQSTMLNIKQNNYLMHLNANNRSRIFAVMKKARGDSPNSVANVLHTPVSTFYGEDVLEGFAADAEFLGKSLPLYAWQEHSLYSQLMVALSARVFDSFMHNPFMPNKMQPVIKRYILHHVQIRGSDHCVKY